MNVKGKLAAIMGATAAAVAVSTVTYFEGYVPYVYSDPIGRLAVCYGHDDQGMEPGRKYSREQCNELLDDDLSAHAAGVLACTPQLAGHTNQLAAMVSFAYNVGVGAYCGSTAARKLRAGDIVGACRELPRWVYAGGRKLAGLVKRRNAEMQICLSGLH